MILQQNTFLSGPHPSPSKMMMKTTFFKILYMIGLVPVTVSVISPCKGISAPILSLGRLV